MGSKTLVCLKILAEINLTFLQPSEKCYVMRNVCFVKLGLGTKVLVFEMTFKN